VELPAASLKQRRCSEHVFLGTVARNRVLQEDELVDHLQLPRYY